MTIQRVGPLEQIQPGEKARHSDDVKRPASADSINVSSEAREMSEVYHVRELAAAAPDISPERIAEMRQKINDPAYINDTVLDGTANAIMSALGI